jgi:hypothetical protein
MANRVMRLLRGERAEEEQSLLLVIIVAVMVFVVLWLAIGKAGKSVALVFAGFFKMLWNSIKSMTGMDYLFR